MLPLLLASPVSAQQQESGDPVMNLPRAPDNRPDNRQGPELNVYRDPVTPTVTPPPALVLPPVVTPTVPPPAAPPPAAETPAPRRDTRPPETRTQQTAPPPQRNERRQAETAVPEQNANGAADTPSTPAPEPEPQVAPAPQNEAANAASAPAEPAPMAAVSDERPLWPWIAGGLALLAGFAFLFLRRRRGGEEREDDFAPVPAPVAVEPVAEPVAAKTPPAPRPVAPPPPPPAPEATTDAVADRARIDLSLEVTGARNSLLGLTVGYALTLTNRGERAARDVLVRGLIGNAGGDQQALLQPFVGGETGLPIHSAVSIAPGASQRLTGELRLAADQFAPVPVGERLLLIPLAAFDAQYHWSEDDAGPAGGADPADTGRIGGAFIIGQEQDPPAERLAPFRLDLGPRQYRRPGARVAGQFGGH
ncbi:hypothetical protein SAMN02927924_02514 [Sphingobium faniae]|nr:hypothetical protein SAMN02927924_02514 [Sphingobium faniae]